MSSRIESRRDVLEAAHEGHEEYHPQPRVKRVGVRRWVSGWEGGYDYAETMLNWDMSLPQLVGFLAMLAGFAALLLLLVCLM